MDTKVYQFYHYNQKNVYQDKRSAVCIVPPKEQFLSDIFDILSNKKETITLQLGYTRLHPKDNFCKKIGRDKALANLKPLDFEIVTIANNKTFTYFTLTAIDNNISIYISMEIKKGRKSVYFTGYSNYNIIHYNLNN